MTKIDASTTVRDLLTSHPEAFSVLLEHGMCEDCRADPPAVELSHFANKHCGGRIGELIDELQAVIATKP
jgi:hypothetical protein